MLNILLVTFAVLFLRTETWLFYNARKETKVEAFLLINVFLRMAKLGFGDLFELYSGNYIFLYKLATLITANCRRVMIEIGVKAASRVPWHL